MTDLLRVHSDLHAAHVEAVGVLERFVARSGLLAGEKERDAVRDLFDLAREWQQAMDILRELLDEANAGTMNDPSAMSDGQREEN